MRELRPPADAARGPRGDEYQIRTDVRLGAGAEGFAWCACFLGGFMTTIEGNSNDQGSRDGFDVFRLTRKINAISKGFIDCSGR